MGVEAFKSQGLSFGQQVAPPARGSALIGVVMFSNILFNLTDLATTFVALGNGLGEGNSLLLTISAAFGLNVFASLVAVKVIFVAGAAVIALVGARSTSHATRNFALCYLLTSALIFYAVSLNNIFWISS